MINVRATITRHPYLSLSVGLFVACLLFNAFDVGYPSSERSVGLGFQALLFGWWGVFEGIPAWLANPVLVLAWFVALRQMHKFSLQLSLIALALMLSFLAVTEVDAGASGRAASVTGYGLGYWLWVGSALAQAVGASVLSRGQKHAQQS